MSMHVTLRSHFDPKLRASRKGARLRVRDAKKLCRRARKKAVSTEVVRQVEERTEILANTARGDDPAAIEHASQKLLSLLDKHLGGYRRPAWAESLESIGVAVLVALFLRAFVVEAFKIPSGSMIPTLAIGDQIFVNKYLYGIRVPFTSVRLVDFSVPERGEVVVFIFPGESREDYIKRVVGLPGDEIRIRRGVLYINDQPVERKRIGVANYWDRDAASGRWHTFEATAFEETLDDHTYTTLRDGRLSSFAADYGPIIVPDGHVFVMGDNRDHSHDSRAWGAVPLENVLGRALFVWWSWGQDGLDSSRLGTWIE